MPRAIFIGDESLWAGGHPQGHPLRPERLRDTWEMVHAYQAFSVDHANLVPPCLPTEEDLLSFHTRNYIRAVKRLSQGDISLNYNRYGFGSGDNPIFAGMFESEGLKVGAALAGADLLLRNEADVAFSFAGGLHHASRNKASGFCVFGDGAIAIQRLVTAGWRVAYIDIDAHHGDGVQAAFYDDNRVLTISLHESGHYLFPGTGFIQELGQGCGYRTSVNIPLFPYTDDDIYLWAFDQIVPTLIERFAPDAIVAQLGVDAHWRDPLTHLCLTTHGLEALFRRIQELAPRWLAVGGGGYDPSVVPRAWTLAWGVMSDQSFPDRLPEAIAGNYDPPHLHDTKPAPVTPNQQFRARDYAEGAVRDLKRLLKF